MRSRSLPCTSKGTVSIKSYAPKLLNRAQKPFSHAIAPSSNFRVGAALLTHNQRVFTGCNIESPVYLGLCAERVALFKALSEGAREFVALGIVCEGSETMLPCGTCRQLLWEFAPKLRIVVSGKGRITSYRLKDLLPIPFERNGRRPFREP